jgi:hypothetical protein
MAATRGFRIMHWRNGRYWLMFDQAMVLDDINQFVREWPLKGSCVTQEAGRNPGLFHVHFQSRPNTQG